MSPANERARASAVFGAAPARAGPSAPLLLTKISLPECKLLITIPAAGGGQE